MVWSIICVAVGYVLGHYWHEDVKYIGQKIKKAITNKN